MSTFGEGIVQPPQWGENAADSLRLEYERIAQTVLGLEEGAHFAAQFNTTLPAQTEPFRRRIHPLVGVKHDDTADYLKLDATILFARKSGSAANKPSLIAALGNFTLEGRPVAVTIPYAQSVDYYPEGLKGLGPYTGFCIEAVEDDVRLLAKPDGSSDWHELFTDAHTTGPQDRPGLFLATQLVNQARRIPTKQIRKFASVAHLSGRKMLPPHMGRGGIRF